MASQSSEIAISATETPAADCPSCSHPKLNAGEGFGIGFGVGIVLTFLVIAGIYVGTRRSMVKDTLREVVDTVCQAVGVSNHHRKMGPNRKISKKRRRHLTDSTTPVTEEPEPEPESGTVLDSLDDLPQPIAHDNLRLELSRVEIPIKNFVDNYFHNGEVSTTELQDAFLERLAGEPNMREPWSSALANVDTRAIALRCFIAQVIFKSMEFDRKPSLSILPPSILILYSQMISSEEAPNQRYLLALWRQTTAYLLRGRNPDRISKHDSRRDSIHSVASAIVEALGPLRNQKSPIRCLEVLQDIVADAAILAFRLFSQEDEWYADWSTKKGGIVVFPALRMLSNDAKTGSQTETRISRAVRVQVGVEEM